MQTYPYHHHYTNIEKIIPFDHDKEMMIITTSSTIVQRNIETGDVIYKYSHRFTPVDILIHKDNTRMIVYGSCHMCCWDILEHQMIWRVEERGAHLWHALLINHDQDIITWGSNRYFIRWNTNTGTKQMKYEGHQNNIYKCWITQQQPQRIISYSQIDTTIREWDIQQGTNRVIYNTII